MFSFVTSTNEVARSYYDTLVCGLSSVCLIVCLYVCLTVTDLNHFGMIDLRTKINQDFSIFTIKKSFHTLTSITQNVVVGESS